MFEADLRIVDSLSSTNLLDRVNIGVQWDGFSAPVPAGKAIFALH